MSKPALVALMAMVYPLAARAEVPPHPAMANIGVEERVGNALPLDLEFRDPAGEPVRLGDLFRPQRPVVLTLAYSACPMLCSLMLRALTEVVPKVEGRAGEDYLLVTVSIDPEETTATARRKQEVLVEQISRPGELQAWTYLLGEEANIRKLAGAVGFNYAKDPTSGEYAHPAAAFVLTPQGNVSAYLYGLHHEPAVVTEALDRAARGLTAAASGSVMDAILRCFRFDPASRRYGWLIRRGLQVGAVGILLSVAAGLFLLFRRDARRRSGDPT